MMILMITMTMTMMMMIMIIPVEVKRNDILNCEYIWTFLLTCQFYVGWAGWPLLYLGLMRSFFVSATIILLAESVAVIGWCFSISQSQPSFLLKAFS